MSRNFSGTDTCSIGVQSQLNVTAVTFGGWFKGTSFTNAYNTGPSYNSNNASNGCYQIFVKSNGKIAIYVSVGTNTFVFYDGTGATLSTGTWYSIIATYSSSAGLVGYLNGSSDGTGAANGPLNTNNGSFAIGFDQETSGRNWTGSLAEMFVYNTVLSVGEISALAKGARPFLVRPSALKGFWPLDGLESPEPDLSGFAANGTLSGTTLASGPPTMMFTPRWFRYEETSTSAPATMTFLEQQIYIPVGINVSVTVS